MHDVIVIGGGPAGVQCALACACEGYDTVLYEASDHLGGQLFYSAKVENVAGYEGASGYDISKRYEAQLKKFGVRVHYNLPVSNVTYPNVTGLSAHEGAIPAQANVIVLAIGLQPKDPPQLPNPKHISGKTFRVYGTGNGAAQAIEYLIQHGAYAIYTTAEMNCSAYLKERIDKHVENDPEVDADYLLHFTGAKPNAHWTGVGLESGYIYTNIDFNVYRNSAPQSRVLAIGDIRWGSVKRASAAIGEGAAVMQTINRYMYNA